MVHPDTSDSNTWWGTQMHGGEPQPYMAGSPHTTHGGLASQHASPGGGSGWMGPEGRPGPAQGHALGPHPTWPLTKAGLPAGQATI